MRLRWIVTTVLAAALPIAMILEPPATAGPESEDPESRPH